MKSNMIVYVFLFGSSVSQEGVVNTFISQMY